jgi:GTPase SAR1 family protein
MLHLEQYRHVQATLLVLGLDNAGKTTILRQISGEDAQNVVPTQVWAG